MQEIIENLKKQLNERFKDENTGHDMHHLIRAMNLALHIQEKEGGDRLIIGVAALLHDVHRILQKETAKYCSPKESLPLVKQMLERAKVPEEKHDRILYCVEFHEEYSFGDTGKSKHNIETQIVQDADNLDAIGAIGIARSFMFGGGHNVAMWVPELPLKEGVFTDSKTDPSTIHHFYNKLLRLKDDMNTKTAKAMAESRHRFMEGFLEQFFAEWKGER